ncbi:MAG: hypothetical protein H0U75_09485 [Legionella sp.]|nr:hypothetical protein [Legionella sp.]
MKRILMSIMACLFPWIVILLYNNPPGAMIALVMQVTLVGWPFASAWALRLINADKKNNS